MPTRILRMMRTLLMLASVIALGGFLMLVCRLGMILGGTAMMVGSLFRHTIQLLMNSDCSARSQVQS